MTYALGDGWVDRHNLIGDLGRCYDGENCLIVAGFHRSGTSALARTLHEAGLFMAERMSGSADNNKHGYFEDMDILRLHEQLLHDNGKSWDDPDLFVPYVAKDTWYAFAEIILSRQTNRVSWGFKDPRVCLFLPIWKYLLPKSKILAVYRRPEDCIRSLESRHASNLIEGWGTRERDLKFWSSRDLAARLWLRYNEALLQAVESYGDDVAPIPFEMIADDQGVINMINDRWNFDLDLASSSRAWDESSVNHVASNVAIHDRSLAMRIEACLIRLESATARLRRANVGLTNQ